MKTIFALILGCCLLTFSTSSACAQEETLHYRLKWLFNSSVAGDIYAESGGYFAKEGLKVKVKEGSPEKNAIKELELGQADFGVASADQVIRALEKGAKVVVLAQIFQINPMQWIYRVEQAPIEKATDLKGRSIGYTYGGNDETIMKTLLARAGISQVKITGARFDFTPFLTGKVDLWPVYRNSQGVILKEKLGKEGEKVLFFNPADFGVNFVANSVVTSEKMVKEHPETVRKFRRALLKGWKAAMNPENEVKVLEAIALRDRDNSREIRRRQLQATRLLVVPKNLEEMGQINRKAWQQTEEIMLEEKQIKRAVHVERVLWEEK
ncbi:ABC transporter substrate-binding protein [Desulfotalea psychrophila]|uniref:Thiamine pyrimidine synthase n=1 Tax=Desulfotalea psychrophila (strain LSv54 / DSM 12343) TaxID=177439 RepID=Q6AQN9_DESPS|nr:ABC transporter substrate-binding protein [Desulfotalea psychrophila]CAG35334.1 hypothetical protein DP0605 [Desulfotalea psychrophila LSv54]